MRWVVIAMVVALTVADRGDQEQAETTNSIGMSLVLIPAGTFVMGEAKTGEQEVTLTTPFYLGVCEVTNAQWRRVMERVPSQWKDDDRPVEKVSWKDAVDFCARLSARSEERAAGRVYRLPTEAEWEYACRAGTAKKYSFGDDERLVGVYGWCDENSDHQTQPVGQKKPNAWGLHDMHGNAWEWVGDWYGPYPNGAVTDPTGPSSGVVRCLRGGCWKSSAKGCRSALRGRHDPSGRRSSVGFRVALTSSAPEPPERSE
jgi:formylglycine-generating enzyme required for sulfatase activity